MTSTQPNSSNSGRGSESVANRNGSLTSGNTKTSSVVAAGAPDVIDVDFMSDDEMLVAVDEMEKNLAATQKMELESNEDCENVPGKTKFISAECSYNADLCDAGEGLSLSSTRSKLPESFSNKPEFPGKGVALGQKSSTIQQPSSSSSGQVLRRLPGIGLIEVRAAGHQDKVTDAEIRNSKDAGELATQMTGNVESDEVGFWSLSLNDKSCTIEDQSKLNLFLSNDTECTNVDNQKLSNASSNRSKQMQKSYGTGFHKAKSDIRFWLSDPSREVGEVVRVPNFTSVSNPKFHKVKAEQEDALPSLKIPRQWKDDHDVRPAKKIRMDNELNFEMAAMSGRHIGDSETKKTVNGACDKGMNVDNSRGMPTNNSRAVNMDNGRTVNLDNNHTTNVGNDRADSLDHCSMVNTDCIMCSDDSDIDESQTIATVFSRIQASVSIDDVASVRQDDSSCFEEITFVEPPHVADTFPIFVIPENSPEHTNSSLPNHASCPVCGLLVDVAAINEHLDLCLS